jgi:Ca-activated chloride channel family protein
MIWACGTTPEPKATMGARAEHTEVTDPGTGAAAASEAEDEAAAPVEPAGQSGAAVADVGAGNTREKAATGGVDALLNMSTSAPAERSAPAASPRRPRARRLTARMKRGGGARYANSGGLGALGGAPLQLAPAPVAPPAALPGRLREGYTHTPDNPFMQVVDQPLSTFSIDVDTASYANVRRMLRAGQRPPADAVRVEEMLNYFSYDYPEPGTDRPFSIHSEVATAPWSPDHRLVHIGLEGRAIAASDVPTRNLVFLLDVSGSMQSHDKLPLLKRGMELLARQLREQDRLSVVVYAGASGLVLPPTSGAQQGEILSALHRLRAGGSTNGAAGIELAYRVAQDQFVRGGINRVILATDGDFNVGVTSEGQLTRLIERRRQDGVFLTVLGFGRGNLQDAKMELLADKGNGNYAYIDSIAEARKVLVREAGSTLVTIAKDVKLQVEWNPRRVAAYRLIGYVNRMLAARDFADDRKDAGEIGAGHTVTALYEVVLAPDAAGIRREVGPLKYQSDRHLTDAAHSDELMTLSIRYKKPDGQRSRLLSRPVFDRGLQLDESSDDFRFSAAVAGFGMLLRDSHHRGNASVEQVRALARGALGADPHGDRRELLELIDAANRLGVGG